MQPHHETTNLEKPANANLRGPFCPFTIALRNIRQNLISKYRTIEQKNIQDEILKEIITLNILLDGHMKATADRYMEFPVAACWRLKVTGEHDARGRYFYSGEFPSDKGAWIPKEIKRVRANIRQKLRELLGRPASEGVFDSFAGESTEYSESLRDIKGYWRIRVEGFVFLILYTYFPSQTEVRSEEMSIVRDHFEKFLLDGLVNFRTLIKRGRHSTLGDGTVNRATGLASDVPILEDIVSRIQDEIAKVKSDATLNVGRKVSARTRLAFEEAFSVVFVRPALNEEEKLCFRYILTHKQREYLKRTDPDDIRQLVRKKESEVLNKFSVEFKLLIPQFGPIKTVSDLARAINMCTPLWRDNTRIDEFVRRAVFSYYAFHPKSLDAFDQALTKPPFTNSGTATAEMNSLGLADTIEMSSNWVTAKQAFIITQILRSKSSDVVSDFINHPFAKYLQHSTDELLDLFQKDFSLLDGEALYPAVLHVFEMLFFPKRFFMYPVYEFEDAVLLLCAFNADYYLQSRASLKAIIDRYAPAIFNTILAYQQSDTSRLFEDAAVAGDSKSQPIIISEIEKQYLTIFERRLKHLLRLFCRDMVYVDSLRPLKEDRRSRRQFPPLASRAIVREDKVSVKLDFANEEKIYKVEIEPEVARGNRFIIASTTAKHILKLYVAAYADIFSRTIRNIDLARKIERSSLSAVVAHAVKTSLSPYDAV